jgi:hypothetical protein
MRMRRHRSPWPKSGSVFTDNHASPSGNKWWIPRSGSLAQNAGRLPPTEEIDTTTMSGTDAPDTLGETCPSSSTALPTETADWAPSRGRPPTSRHPGFARRRLWRRVAGGEGHKEGAEKEDGGALARRDTAALGEGVFGRWRRPSA